MALGALLFAPIGLASQQTPEPSAPIRPGDWVRVSFNCVLHGTHGAECAPTEGQVVDLRFGSLTIQGPGDYGPNGSTRPSTVPEEFLFYLPSRTEPDGGLTQALERPKASAVPLLLGTLGAGVGGFGLALVGIQADLALNGTGEWGGLGGAIFGGMAGLALGSATAVYLFGRHQVPGRGMFWPTLGGSAAGLLTAMLGGAAIARSETPISPVVAAIWLCGLPALGATVGYNLSARQRPQNRISEFIGKVPVDVWASPNLDGSMSFGFRSSF